MYKLYHEHMCIVLPKRDNCFLFRKKGKLTENITLQVYVPESDLPLHEFTRIQISLF